MVTLNVYEKQIYTTQQKEITFHQMCKIFIIEKENIKSFCQTLLITLQVILPSVADMVPLLFTND